MKIAAMMLPNRVREALLTKTAEDTHDVVVVTGVDGVPVWANRAFEKLSGYSLAEIASLAHLPFSSSRTSGGDAASTILQALKARKPVKTQIMGYTEKGDPVWFDLEISAMFDAASRFGGYIAIQRDISYCVERSCDLSKAVMTSSKAEGRLRAAIEAISDGFAIYDENDRLLIANQAFYDIHQGVEEKIGPGSTFEELVRCTVADGLLDIGDEDPERWIGRQVKMAHLPSSEVHMRYAHGGWMSRRHKRMQNNETVRVWTNINSLKRQQAELEQARALAESADRAKTQFLTNMSHEIRTPMNGIIGFNELLLGSELTERQKEYATHIQSSSRSLMLLIDEILDLGKIERGTLEIEALPFRLSELIAAARGLEAFAESKSLKLLIECPLAQETIAVGDLKRIRQILINLIGNAIKFTETGQVTLTISGENSGLKLVVSDTGRGIPPERQKAIFERFYQGDELGSGKVQGSGLGLAITKDLAELMGGDIAVESGIGRGSAFTVWLPLWLDLEKAPGPAQEPAPSLLPANPGNACVYDVLVAEDHPINLKLALALLHAAGCETRSAENGQQALVELEKADYDLIIMDSLMPVMTGVEAMKMIRRRPDWKCHIPILSLTADAMKGADEYHAMAGADMYMSKPLRSDCFIGAVKRLAERGRDLREKNAASGAPDNESSVPEKCP